MARDFHDRKARETETRINEIERHRRELIHEEAVALLRLGFQQPSMTDAGVASVQAEIDRRAEARKPEIDRLFAELFKLETHLAYLMARRNQSAS